jgi:hypothetical protein
MTSPRHTSHIPHRISVGERMQYVLPKNWRIAGATCPLRNCLLLADIDTDGEIEMAVGFQDGHLAIYKSSLSGFHIAADDHKIYPCFQVLILQFRIPHKTNITTTVI